MTQTRSWPTLDLLQALPQLWAPLLVSSELFIVVGDVPVGHAEVLLMGGEDDVCCGVITVVHCGVDCVLDAKLLKGQVHRISHNLEVGTVAQHHQAVGPADGNTHDALSSPAIRLSNSCCFQKPSRVLQFTGFPQAAV